MQFEFYMLVFCIEFIIHVTVQLEIQLSIMLPRKIRQVQLLISSSLMSFWKCFWWDEPKSAKLYIGTTSQDQKSNQRPQEVTLPVGFNLSWLPLDKDQILLKIKWVVIPGPVHHIQHFLLVNVRKFNQQHPDVDLCSECN